MRKIKLLILLLFYFFCCACHYKIYVPERVELKKIQFEKYIPKINNCIDKGIKYRNTLKLKGIKNRLVSGIVSSGIVSTVHSEHHLWVEVYCEETKTWHLIDPTWNKEVQGQGYETKYYPERKIWIIYKNLATEQEIKNMDSRCIEKVYLENIPGNSKDFSFFQALADKLL